MPMKCDALEGFTTDVAEKLDAYMVRFERKVAQDICKKLQLLVDRQIHDPAKAVGLLTNDHSPSEWAAARTLIAVVGTSALGRDLSKLLRDARRPRLRLTLVGLLGLLGGTEARDAIIEVLRHDQDARLRFDAAHHLALFRKDQHAASALIAVLESSDETEAVRAEAARSLGIAGATDAEPLLLAALEDRSPRVRFWAADALGSVGADDVIGPLLSMAEHDALTVIEDGSLREAALSGISNILARRAEKRQ